MAPWMFLVPVIPAAMLAVGHLYGQHRTKQSLATALRHPDRVARAWLAGPVGSVRLELELAGEPVRTVADNFTWSAQAAALRSAGVTVADMTKAS